MNKKAYYYSLAVLVILTVAIAFFSIFQSPGYSKESLVQNERIFDINAFIDAVNEDAETALRVATFRSFIAVEQELLRDSGYVDSDFDDIMHELILNGSINEVNVSVMNVSSLNEWKKKMLRVAGFLHVDFGVEVLDIDLYQETPWDVIVEMEGVYHIEDNLSQSRWDRPFVVEANLPIKHFHDPVYTVGSSNTYYQLITPSNATSLPVQLMNHISNGMYVKSDLSPSFLQRLQGDFSVPAPGTGIESLVFVPDLELVGIVHEGSVVDWQYLHDLGPGNDTCNLTPSWLRIDTDHVAQYGFDPVTCT